MASEDSAVVRIGPAGWSYPDWKDIVYPPGMSKNSHPLTYLAQFFDTVEVNSTFYGPPNWRNCASWVQKAAGNPRFMFAVKLWDRFTHQRDSWPEDRDVRRVTEGLAPLADEGKLGAVLVQFPWSFKRTPDNRRWLARVIDTFDAYPLVLEIRHASWNRPEVFEGLAERRVAFCNIDQPLFRNSLTPTSEVTARVGYVRLHGRNAANWFRSDAGRDDRYDYLYSVEELAPWVDKVDKIRSQTGNVYVITNNHYRGQAVVNAFELAAALGKGDFDLPAHLVEAYPRLNRLEHGNG